jgi:L-amino acid N-acyltransferase YncA
MIIVREMVPADSRRVLDIYRMGLETGNATFETKVPVWQQWDSRHLPHSRFVAEVNGFVTGWAALSSYSTREVYRGVAELSIYVAEDFRGKNIGSELMINIISSSEKNGIWTLISSVFPENKATLRLHEKYGFRIIGRRERIAMLNGVWRDTILLERRSSL